LKAQPLIAFSTNFREALRTGFYELQGARDAYRTNVGSEGMNKDLIMRFIEVQAVLMAPIIPHFSEYVWTKLGKPGTVRKAPYPVAGKIDHNILEQMEFLEAMLHSFRLRKDTYLNPKPRKGEKTVVKPAPPTKISIVVAKNYPGWMQSVLKVVAPVVEKENGWRDDKIMAAVKENEDTKKALKNVMPFVATLKEEYATRGKSALNLELPFDEKALFEGEEALIKRSLEVQTVEVTYDETATKCQPGKPFVSFA
jgi:leucyl-tRNA synthetase